MWIRTQDKLCLTRVDALPIINHDEGKRLWSIIGIGKFQYKLGSYKSEERAIEVLDEIQERISPKFNYKGNNEEVDVFIKTQMLNSMIAVYQMPNE